MTVSNARDSRPPGPHDPVELGMDNETLASLQEIQRTYGNIASITTHTGREAFFVNDPAVIHQVLVRRHAKYVKGRDFQRVKMLLGNGLFVSDGAVWRRARTMVQPGFKAQAINELVGLIVDCAHRRAEKWIEKAEAVEPVNVTKEMSAYALEVILRAIFGNDYDNRLVTGDHNPFAFLSEESDRDLQLVLKFRALRKLVLSIVLDRREQGRHDEGDFLSLYMSAEDKSGVGFSDEELLDELMTLIIAGFETSAGTLNWAWYLISGHPEVEDKLVREIQRMVPDIESINSRSVSDLSYLGQVLNETMRLYPPGWIFSRRAIEEDRIAEYDVPVGTDIYISPYILHRSSEYWRMPDQFDPDRFGRAGNDLTGNKGVTAFIPFSLGPRRCIGEYFGILEMKIKIALLLQRFHVVRTTDVDPGLKLGINLRSDRDIYLQAKLRKSRHRSPKYDRTGT
jgi:cytochrome P450